MLQRVGVFNSGQSVYIDVLTWLENNCYRNHPELVAIVKEWVSHWCDNWSEELSRSQRERVSIIGDWIEDHYGDRRWATYLVLEQIVTKRLYYKDGSYMDVSSNLAAREYENDPEWDHSEELTEKEGDSNSEDAE